MSKLNQGRYGLQGWTGTRKVQSHIGYYLAFGYLALACVLLANSSSAGATSTAEHGNRSTVAPSKSGPTPIPTRVGKKTVPAVDIFTDSGITVPLQSQVYYIPGAGWADYDNDGRLDLALAGFGFDGDNDDYLFIFHNTGSGFTNSGSKHAATLVAPKPGDYDNDGAVDLMAMGTIYRNDGGGQFDDTGIGSIGGDWGDFNQDGKIDVIGGGIRRNTGNGIFTDSGASFPFDQPDAYITDESWADYDNDGKLDVLVSGQYIVPTDCCQNSRPGQPDVDPTPPDIEFLVALFHNDGNFGFSQVETNLPALPFAEAWGDYDNDGLLDLAASGLPAVYHNEGNGQFQEIYLPVSTEDLSDNPTWGDYDNDGRLDLLMASVVGSSGNLLHNDGNGVFTIVQNHLPGDTVAWGDYDGDGRLDILAEEHGGGRVMSLYHNNSPATNQPPTAPTSLTSSIISGTYAVTLNWAAAGDDHTPAPGLSYNLRVGTTPGGSDVYSSMADPVTGQRRISVRGPIQGTSYTLTNLMPSQTYYWSVQAIDTAFAGGPFAAEQSLTNPCVFNLSDVQQSDYFYAGAIYLTCRGAISGYGDGTFKPFENATRAQLVKIVVQAEGWPLVAPATPHFSDVPRDFPFYAFIETAYRTGVIAGYPDGSFRPYNAVTRGQAAKIVVIAAGWQWLDPPSPHFTDVPQDNPFYRFVETAYAYGVIGGYDDRTFRWEQNLTRGQIAKMVYLAATTNRATK